MSKLFIGNTTKHHMEFCFKPAEISRYRVLAIPSGEQVELGEGLTPFQISSIIEQVERYGGKPHNENPGSNFSGLIYRLDKPVSVTDIEDGHAAVVDRQEHISVVEATKAAMGMDMIDKMTSKKTGRKPADSVGVSFVKEVGLGEKASVNDANFNVSIAPDGRDELAVR